MCFFKAMERYGCGKEHVPISMSTKLTNIDSKQNEDVYDMGYVPMLMSTELTKKIATDREVSTIKNTCRYQCL